MSTTPFINHSSVYIISIGLVPLRVGAALDHLGLLLLDIGVGDTDQDIGV